MNLKPLYRYFKCLTKNEQFCTDKITRPNNSYTRVVAFSTNSDKDSTVASTSAACHTEGENTWKNTGTPDHTQCVAHLSQYFDVNCKISTRTTRNWPFEVVNAGSEQKPERNMSVQTPTPKYNTSGHGFLEGAILCTLVVGSSGKKQLSHTFTEVTKNTPCTG